MNTSPEYKYKNQERKLNVIERFYFIFHIDETRSLNFSYNAPGIFFSVENNALCEFLPIITLFTFKNIQL